MPDSMTLLLVVAMGLTPIAALGVLVRLLPPSPANQRDPNDPEVWPPPAQWTVLDRQFAIEVVVCILLVTIAITIA